VVRVWRLTAASTQPALSFTFDSAVNTLAFSTVNNILIATFDAAQPAVIDCDTGEGGRRLVGSAASGLRFASDGRLLAVTSGTRVTIYDAAAPTGALIDD
jgi:hypothetical protein